MKRRRKIAVIFGTRPDTIKLAPIILALRREPLFQPVTIATAQHRQMLDQVLLAFDITPDHDLNSMKPRQTLADITRNTIAGLDRVLVKEKPDMVLVQGDTTTTFVGSLAGFYLHIPVGHVEAGLRTNNKAHPFPEEINRRLTTTIADLNFAPTETARQALLQERVDPASIYLTGNSVIDALGIAVKRKYTFSNPLINKAVAQGKRAVLITMHRRENLGAPMQSAAHAIRRLAEHYHNINFVFPVHLNPAVKETVFPILQHSSNVLLTTPLDYLDFVNLMARSYLILTDSGGVQEEGPALGKPVLVLREVTERPEAVEFGTAKLVGLNEERIYKTARRLLDNEEAYRSMALATNPYGDGFAARRTIHALKRYFGLSRSPFREFRPS